MQIDARTLGSGQVVKSDVCIIGAGPAGTTLARELLGSGVRVAVLESGGTHFNRQADDLSVGEASGVLDQALNHVRARQLGGTANHWILKMADKRNGFRHTTLDALDFEERDYIPYSGWPITRAELDPYYARVHARCDIGPFEYGARYWAEAAAQPLDFGNGQITSSVFTFGPTQCFTSDFPAAFAKDPDIDVYLYATAVELLPAENGQSVQRACVRTLEGKELYFEARYFVLAAGGFETPRLLLNSRSRHADGIGNQNDVVGRYYVDHSLVSHGHFYPRDMNAIKRLAFYDMRLVRGSSVLGKFSLAPEVLKRERLRNFGSMLFPKPSADEEQAFYSLRTLTSELRSRHIPDGFWKHVTNVARGHKYIAHVMYQRFVHDAEIMIGLSQGGWSRLNHIEKHFSRLEFMSLTEQSPKPYNRVTLTREKDALGCPRIRVHMEWSEEDLDSIRRAERLMVEQLKPAGLGEYRHNGKDEDEIVFATRTAHHLMGTTRMHDDPKFGVVDRDCKVHEVDNLYIASSSVFTTGGYANPTLTLLALSVRVADTLKNRLQKAEVPHLRVVKAA